MKAVCGKRQGGGAVNHALVVSTGSTALLGEEVICVIARSYVLWTERRGDRMVLEASFVMTSEGT